MGDTATGPRTVNQDRVNQAFVKAREFFTANDEGLDQLDVTLTNAVMQTVAQRAVQLHDVGTDVVNRIKYPLVDLITKYCDDIYSVLGGEREVRGRLERNLAGRRRKNETQRVRSGTYGALHIINPRDTADLDE